MITDHDVIGLTETWLKPLNEASPPGYTSDHIPPPVHPAKAEVLLTFFYDRLFQFMKTYDCVCLLSFLS